MFSYQTEEDEIRFKAASADTKRFRSVLFNVLPDLLGRFSEKSQEYGDADKELGVKAQFVDINRKIGKVKTAIWDEQPERLTSETVEEVLWDLVAHCLITLDMMRPSQDVRFEPCPWSLGDHTDTTEMARLRCVLVEGHIGSHINRNGARWVDHLDVLDG